MGKPCGSRMKDGCVLMCLCLCTALLPGLLSGQVVDKPSPWQAWQFLLGDWEGEGTGEPGEGIGNFSFATDLQGTVLVRRNHSDFPAARGRPATSHDDLMILYQEAGRPTRASYFDNEGHVIQYAAEFSRDSNTVIFLSDPAPGTPRFRLTYGKKAEGLVTIRFEFAPPGKPDEFVRYIEAVARRK